MPMFYDEIFVSSGETVTVSPITLPRDNRPFKLVISGSYCPTDVYFYYGGSLEGPLYSGDRINSPEKLLQLFNKPVYDAWAVAVKKSPQCVQSYNPITWDYTIESSLNLDTAANLCINYWGNLQITDTKKAALSFLNNSVNPAEDVNAFIWSYLNNRKSLINNTLDEIRDGKKLTNRLQRISEDLSAECQKEVNELYGWAVLSNFSINTVVTNMDSVLSQLNRKAATEIERDEKLFNARLEMEKFLATQSIEYQKLMLQAIVDIYGRAPLDDNLARVIITYIQSNPGLSYNELTTAFKDFRLYSGTFSPEALLDKMKDLCGKDVLHGLYLSNGVNNS